jgi:hypothetical protein
LIVVALRFLAAIPLFIRVTILGECKLAVTVLTGERVRLLTMCCLDVVSRTRINILSAHRESEPEDLLVLHLQAVSTTHSAISLEHSMIGHNLLTSRLTG